MNGFSQIQIVLKATAKKLDDHDRAYRGYVAVDDVQFQPIDEAEEQCKGFHLINLKLLNYQNIYLLVILRALHFRRRALQLD